MYYIALLILLSLVLFWGNKTNKMLFFIVFVLLCAMACFRYGQGSDYFNYLEYYDAAGFYWNTNPIMLLSLRDPGFVLLNLLSVLLDIPFSVFTAFITSVIMILFYRFLSKQCNYSFFSLFFFFCFIYMVYALSIMRQGLCMAFFYAVLYPLLKEKRYIIYIFFTIILITIHLSSLLYLLFPIILKWHPSDKLLTSILVLSLFLLFGFSTLFKHIPIGFIQSRLAPYLSESSSNQIFAMLLRCVFIIPLFYIPKKLAKDPEIYKCKLFLVFGFFIYSITSFSELTCSRLWGNFWGFECILLSCLHKRPYYGIYSRKILSFFMFISIVFWYKDVNSFIVQGGYRNCDMFTYPYISVFEDESVLNYYRTHLGHMED